MRPQPYADMVGKCIQTGLLIDANLLLLFAVGQYNPKLISTFDRLSAFTEFDYKLIAHLVSEVGRLIAVPNLVTEVSNLAGKLGKKVLPAFFAKLAENLSIVDEHYISSLAASTDRHFTTLGLTDAVIIAIACDKGCVVMTDDATLYSILSSRGVHALNFNHIRQFAGEFR
jgi:hypothetical protein